MSQLTNEQTDLLRSLVAEGISSLGEIQRRLNEAGAIITYMDLRFLMDDLGLSLAEKPQPVEEKKPEATAEEPIPTGTVSLEVDTVMRPGSLASGQVVFSDGIKATWMLDQMGRLGLTEAPDGYKPSPEDLQEFQIQLRSALESKAL